MKSTTEISIHEDVLCETSFLGILKVSGEDAQSFLQGQLSNDIDLLSEKGCQFSSYSSPKGRMYTCFHLYQSNDAFFILLPKEIIHSVAKRLRMFIMRSKLVIEDLSETWASLGLAGEQVCSAMPQNNVQCIKIPGLNKRLLVMGPAEDIIQAKNTLTENFTHTDSAHWKRLDIHAGLPNIYSATQESFVLQMLNLQLINGVSFTKGCYPGQEVVARMHYLGKLKRRMYRIIIKQTTLPAPGDELMLIGSEHTQSIGKIVDAQLNDTGNIDGLAVIQTSAIDKKIHVDGGDVEIVDLPYAFE